MRIKRGIAAIVVAIVGSVGIAVAAAPAAAASAAVPTVTGSAVCDAETSSWTITWTVTNGNEDPFPISRVTFSPPAPTTTVTGIAAGDIVPPRSAGSLTATATVHSYAAGQASFAIWVGDMFQTSFGATVSLPTVCGSPIPPVATFQPRCYDLLVTVALPLGGYPVDVDVHGSDNRVYRTLHVRPGPPVQSVAVPWPLAGRVAVRIPGVTEIAAGEWSLPDGCVPSQGRFQLLAHANVRYVAPTGQGPVYATGMGTGAPHTTLEFHDTGAGDVAIRVVELNRFLIVAADGSVTASSPHLNGGATAFQLTTAADGTFSLLSRQTGRYLTAESRGAGPLTANRATVGPWEKFTRYAPGTGPGPILALVNSRYVSAESQGTLPLIASRDVAGLWEHFQVEDRGNGLVAFKSLVNGKYVCAEARGTAPLIANRATVGPWETFRIARNSDTSISFQATVNGRYVSADAAGSKPLIANRAAIGPWEKFHELF